VLAAVSFDFSPSTSILGLSVRLETLALAGVIFVALVLAALGSARSKVLVANADGEIVDAGPRLRRDDLILIAFGAVPGAVVGGRLGYGLIHFDYYSSDPRALFDPGQGGFELTLAVALGTLAAVAVARLLAAPVGRWLGVAAVPVMLGLGMGKLGMALGGVGQGAYWDGSWATTYAGSGPWGSDNPSYAAIPSQLIEGGAVLAAVVLLLALPFLLRLRLRRWGWLARPGLAPKREMRFLIGRGRYLTAMTLWVLVRLFVASTWRDARVLGPLVAEQLLMILLAMAVFFGPPVMSAVLALPAAMKSRRASRRAARDKKAAKAAEEAKAAEVAKAAEEAKAAELAKAAQDAPAAEASDPAAASDTSVATLDAAEQRTIS
jgi:prolipoprotein diacylglyceryltransferase